MVDLDAIMERIPTVARLYYTGLGSRRYKRASTMNGPGEPLVHRSHVERELKRLRAELAAAGVSASDGQPSCAAIQSTPAPQGRE